MKLGYLSWTFRTLVVLANIDATNTFTPAPMNRVRDAGLES